MPITCSQASPCWCKFDRGVPACVQPTHSRTKTRKLRSINLLIPCAMSTSSAELHIKVSLAYMLPPCAPLYNLHPCSRVPPKTGVASWVDEFGKRNSGNRHHARRLRDVVRHRRRRHRDRGTSRCSGRTRPLTTAVIVVDCCRSTRHNSRHNQKKQKKNSRGVSGSGRC